MSPLVMLFTLSALMLLIYATAYCRQISVNKSHRIEDESVTMLPFLKLIFYGVVHSIWIVILYLFVNFLFNKDAFKTIFELYRGNKNQ